MDLSIPIRQSLSSRVQITYKWIGYNPRRNTNIIGYITRLYLVDHDYQRSEVCITDDAAMELVKLNRKRRLNGAFQYLTEYLDTKLNTSVNTKDKKRYQLRLRNAKKRYLTECSALEQKRLESWQTEIRYQGNDRKKKLLLNHLSDAYAQKVASLSVKRKYQRTPLSVDLLDTTSGFVLLGGDMMTSGTTEEGREELMKALQKIYSRKRNREDCSHDESNMPLVDRLKTKIEELETMEAACDDEMWLASSHVDLCLKKKKETIHEVCVSIASERNCMPYIRMRNEQYNALFDLYTGDCWRELSWRTARSEMDILSELEGLQLIFPSFSSPFIRNMLMNNDMSSTTLQKIICRTQGKGMTTDEEVYAIQKISTSFHMWLRTR